MNNIKKYDSFNKSLYFIDYFQVLYNKTPRELQIIIDMTKDIEQSPKWHPEGNVYNHTKIVTNRLSNCYNDINLSLSGLFHDLGKTTTTKWDDEKESWTAHGHEDDSVKILDNFESWVKSIGGNFDIIKFVVENHMRIKYLDDFRFQEKVKFLNEPYFNYVVKFNTADYGGEDLTCRDEEDLTDIMKEIEEHNIKQKENKEISSKFNGRILMKLYPDLKDKRLGDAINGFKQFIDEDYGDFRRYVLDNDKEDILNDFEDFYNDWL